MITIEQLLESVDLDFEPRFVTKDENELITIWAEKPLMCFERNRWDKPTEFVVLRFIKLAEFDGKDWTECIYEVPRKTTGKIEKLKYATVSKCGDVLSLTSTVNGFNVVIDKLNTVIDAVNELKGAKNE